MKKEYSDRLNIFWFRRDLRLHDNAGLYHALKGGLPVLPIFIFDRNILDRLENKKDARVEFIFEAVLGLQKQLSGVNSTLEVFYGKPIEVYASIIGNYKISRVFTNEDYEPYARRRDEELAKLFRGNGIEFLSFKDQVIFSKQEVIKDNQLPYTVFTPYSNTWKSLLEENKAFFLKQYPSEKYVRNFFHQPANVMPDLALMGFSESGRKFPSPDPDPEIIKDYAQQRDFPGLDATSHLGIHLRFGTISIREIAVKAAEWSAIFLKELIWRDFYHMILWHFPKVGEGHAFKPAYDKIAWRNNEAEFERWCQGETGYPMIDAGMRQLNETGFMHNRVRMLTASFLTKHLLIDWRWGEAYFAGKLLDYDLASNNGGWQWAAGSGCDAAPYFRIFNPYVQQKKFDPEGSYIRKWLPGYQELSYPEPIVEHSFARERAIRVYRKALGS